MDISFILSIHLSTYLLKILQGNVKFQIARGRSHLSTFGDGNKTQDYRASLRLALYPGTVVAEEFLIACHKLVEPILEALADTTSVFFTLVIRVLKTSVRAGSSRYLR